MKKKKQRKKSISLILRGKKGKPGPISTRTEVDVLDHSMISGLGACRGPVLILWERSSVLAYSQTSLVKMPLKGAGGLV